MNELAPLTFRPRARLFQLLGDQLTWTSNSDRSDSLKQFLQERLKQSHRPFAFLPLPKEGFIDNPAALGAAIKELLSSAPQIAALLDWERRVDQAAADTIMAVVELLPFDKQIPAELTRLLTKFAQIRSEEPAASFHLLHR